LFFFDFFLLFTFKQNKLPFIFALFIILDCSNSDHCKLSKCRDIDLTDARNSNLHADIFRFYLFWVNQNSSKCSFNWTDLSIANNLELLNNLGKFFDK